MGFVHKQPLAKNGMAATLALLRPSGVLADKVRRVCGGDCFLGSTPGVVLSVTVMFCASAWL